MTRAVVTLFRLGMNRAIFSGIVERSHSSSLPASIHRSSRIVRWDAVHCPELGPKPFLPPRKGVLLVLCRRAVAGLVLSAFLTICSLRAQEFSIELQTFEFGASESSGGAFSLVGNLRQSEPSPTLSGGAFAIDGSFESVTPPNASKQETLAPKLSVAISSGRLEIRWSSVGSENYALESSPFLGPDELWSLVLAEPRSEDGDQVVHLEPINSTQFFRLRRR